MEQRPDERAMRIYERVKDSWEDLCARCGRCCFERELADDGEVLVDYASPCCFFDMETHLCRVYDRRFHENERCAKVTLETALFDEYLPEECAYARLFRSGEGESDGLAGA